LTAVMCSEFVLGTFLSLQSVC